MTMSATFTMPPPEHTSQHSAIVCFMEGSQTEDSGIFFKEEPAASYRADIVNSAGEITSPTIPAAIQRSEWKKSDEKRFDALVVREALGTITAPEFQQLEELQTVRRSFRSKRSFDEILYDYERERMLTNIQRMVDQYVRFIPTR